MPYISVNTVCSLTEEQKTAIKSGLGKGITLLPGKDEKALMVDISDAHTMYLSGQQMENGAYVDVRTYGESSFDCRKELTKAIFQLLWTECGIKKEQIYVTFSPFPDWGTRGSLY